MVRQITPKDLAVSLENGRTVRLLDVRQPEEHNICSLPDALLIPLNELPQQAGSLPFGKEEQVVVYCHHGIRSLRGAAYLEQLGFTDVSSLAGGIDAWACDVDPDVARY
ncbi:MAG: rhodanese-like domain-containing protein [Gemmataceae bacterium]